MDQGAACVVARRALGLRLRVRPQVAHAVSHARQARHTSPSSPRLNLVAKALPKRRSTWEPSGLCLRRHSARGLNGPFEPHGVMLATEPGSVPAPGSQPAPYFGNRATDAEGKAVPGGEAVAAAT